MTYTLVSETARSYRCWMLGLVGRRGPVQVPHTFFSQTAITQGSVFQVHFTSFASFSLYQTSKHGQYSRVYNDSGDSAGKIGHVLSSTVDYDFLCICSLLLSPPRSLQAMYFMQQVQFGLDEKFKKDICI